MTMLESPFYEAEIKTSGCAFELLVNDVPCFINYEEGGMAVDWPVNEQILSSGRQQLTLKIYPYREEQLINPRARVEFRLYVRDAFNGIARQLVKALPEIRFDRGEQLLEYSQEDFFEAKVPYVLEGWKNSVYLLREDENILLNAAAHVYDELYTIFKSKNINAYGRLNEDRHKEIATAFYIDSIQMKERLPAMIPKFRGDFIQIPFNQYKIRFFGHGKLVGIHLPYEPCGFMFESTSGDGKVVTELALFHRKGKGEPLSLIR